MNKVLFFAMVFPLLIFSCQTDDKKDKPENNVQKIGEVLSLNDFAESFGGVWIPKDYLTAIIKHKSAYLSHNAIPYISELKIHKNYLREDALFVPSGINNHEGYDFNIWNSSNSTKSEYANSLLEWEQNRDLIFTYNSADTSISILFKDEHDSLVERIDYVRILSQEYAFDNKESAYDYIGRKLILNGKYQILDAAKNDLGIAEFDPNSGEVKGFKYAYYTIATDFIGGFFYPSDYMLLRLESDNYSGQQILSMIHRNDTIYLHETVDVETDTSFNVELGKINYYLIDKN